MWYIIQDCIRHPEKYRYATVDLSAGFEHFVATAGAIGSNVVIQVDRK